MFLFDIVKQIGNSLTPVSSTGEKYAAEALARFQFYFPIQLHLMTFFILTVALLI